jgi:hypothetical protein
VRHLGISLVCLELDNSTEGATPRLPAATVHCLNLLHAEQAEEPCGLALKRARRIAMVGGAARKQHHCPADSRQATDLHCSEPLIRAQVETVQECLGVEAAAVPVREVLSEVHELLNAVTLSGILEVDQAYAPVPQVVGKVGISVREHRALDVWRQATVPSPCRARLARHGRPPALPDQGSRYCSRWPTAAP